MDDNKNLFTPEIYGGIFKIMGVILLVLLWIGTESNTVGFFFILFLVIMMLLRWRFSNLKWTILIDGVICILVAMFWNDAIYGLAFSVFDAAFLFIPWAFFPAVIYSLFFNKADYFLVMMLVQSFFVGLALYGWRSQRIKALIQMDSDSKKRYELESLQNDLLMANVQVARMAELSERGRIAREIHDNAGHEIIAAYMSFQVVESLLGNHTEQGKEMFRESMKRLESGIDKIRESVYDLTPITKFGLDYFKEICDEFKFTPIQMQVYGDTSKVPIYLWSILEPCLKEALTNVMRHSEAKKVGVTLDITPYIVRLCVENDGVKAKIKASGVGLRNLRQRAMTVGGNVSTDDLKGFRLICVLPIV